MSESDGIDTIDLFCGAGGFSNGFENAGYNIKYGIDKNPKALKTFNQNHNSTALEYDIRDGVPNKIKSNVFDIIIGSPPCKGFSDARGSRYIDDDRNGLVFEYIHWVSELTPDIAVMENVTGIRTIGDDFMGAVSNEFNDKGYNIEILELNSANYGVPQKRKRVIIIAVNKNIDISLADIVTDIKDVNYQKTTVDDAFADLPCVSDDGNVEFNYSNVDSSILYSKYVRDLEDDEVLKNHKAKEPTESGFAKKIVQNLKPGEMYRSNRFGNRYRQVWDILSDEFTKCENDCLKFIANHRSRKEYRIQGKTVGHVNIDKIMDELNYEIEIIEESIKNLIDNGWIRKDKSNGKIGYDLNTKSGVRPRYMRLKPDGQSNTILTTDFKPRDKLHPTQNRGLSLREGARIQSFPDSFEFIGSFNDISSQIGNAVPPLMAYHIANCIKDKYEDSSF